MVEGSTQNRAIITPTYGTSNNALVLPKIGQLFEEIQELIAERLTNSSYIISHKQTPFTGYFITTLLIFLFKWCIF